LIDEALTQVAATGETMSLAELHRLRGELLWRQGAGTQEAEVCILQALDIAREQGAKSLELRAAISLARLLQQQNRPRPCDLLANIYQWFGEGLETPDLIEAKHLLKKLP
jgi:predicted ATPase